LVDRNWLKSIAKSRISRGQWRAEVQPSLGIAGSMGQILVDLREAVEIVNEAMDSDLANEKLKFIPTESGPGDFGFVLIYCRIQLFGRFDERSLAINATMTSAEMPEQRRLVCEFHGSLDPFGGVLWYLRSQLVSEDYIVKSVIEMTLRYGQLGASSSDLTEREI
jgi:hypothetical protein